MRLTRRGVIAQRKGGYVWAVYSLAPGVDESVFTTGSFNMTASFGSTPSLMAADGYTVSASGTISLTSAVKTNVSALTAGKYIVSISSSSSTTTTSTQYVYKVTGVTSSGSTFSKTYTVSYERYEISLAMKGADTGNRVESADGTAYPHNGAQGGYWYVLLKGYTTAHVWNVFNIKITYGYKEQNYTSSAWLNATIYTNTYVFYASSYTFDKNKGRYTLVNPTKASSVTTSTLKTKYWVVSSIDTEESKMWYGCTSVDWSGYGTTGTIVATKAYSYTEDKSVTMESKGAATGETVQSVDSKAYPQDGKQDGYWYVYSGTEDIYIDNT